MNGINWAVAPSPIGDFAEGTEDAFYQRSFGNMPTKTKYLDLLSGVDIRKDEQRMTEIKATVTTSSSLMAIGTSYSTTSGSIPVLFPTIVDSKLYDLTIRDTPLASGLIPRVTNRGLFADYVKRTAIQTATWKAESAALPTGSSTYSRVATPIKFAYAIGAVSGPALAASASQGFLNVLQIEVEGAYRSLKELEENTIINGDTTSSTYTDGFNGLIASITTNTSDKDDAELVLGDLDVAEQKIREAKGHPNLIVVDWYGFNRIRALIRPILTASTGQNTLNFGFQNVIYNNMVVVPDLFMPTTAGARECLVLDTQTQNNIQLRVLQDATYVEMAKTADELKFYISLYETMIIVNEEWGYRIYDLA